MTYLIDADWVSSFLNGRREAIELITMLSDAGLSLSVVAYGEIYEGLLGSADQERLRQFEAFPSALDIVNLDVDVARRYARIRVELRSEAFLSLRTICGLPLPL